MTWSEKRYRDYINAIDDFVANRGLRPYSWNTLYDQLVQMYTSFKAKSVSSFCDPDNEWDWGWAEGGEKRDFRKTQGEALWPYLQLSFGMVEQMTSKEARSPSRDANEVMSRSVDRIEKSAVNQQQPTLEGEMERIRLVINSGSGDVNDCYRYAQLLISGESI